MDYEQKYKEALERAKEFQKSKDGLCVLTAESIFPELKESEDERIKKRILLSLEKDLMATKNSGCDTQDLEQCIAWLEKQGTSAKLSEEEQDRIVKCVFTSCAESFINYLDAHKKEGKMCVSNGECEDIENAFHNAMWDRLHRYYCKYIEKQGEQKPTWSDEDESTLNELIIGFHAYKDLYPNFWKLRTDEIIEWLKKKKDEHTTDNG